MVEIGPREPRHQPSPGLGCGDEMMGKQLPERELSPPSDSVGRDSEADRQLQRRAAAG